MKEDEKEGRKGVKEGGAGAVAITWWWEEEGWKERGEGRKDRSEGRTGVKDAKE